MAHIGIASTEAKSQLVSNKRTSVWDKQHKHLICADRGYKPLALGQSHFKLCENKQHKSTQLCPAIKVSRGYFYLATQTQREGPNPALSVEARAWKPWRSGRVGVDSISEETLHQYTCTPLNFSLWIAVLLSVIFNLKSMLVQINIYINLIHFEVDGNYSST